MKQYEKLIDECGIKFFIKYYKQVKVLPLRDVVVSENYPFEEKQKRLLAVKGIIDLDLAEYTLNKIIDSYSGILEQSYIEKAKALLVGCRGEVKQVQEREIGNNESEEYTTTISAPTLLSECRDEGKQDKEREIDNSESEEYAADIPAHTYEDNWDD